MVHWWHTSLTTVHNSWRHFMPIIATSPPFPMILDSNSNVFKHCIFRITTLQLCQHPLAIWPVRVHNSVSIDGNPLQHSKLKVARKGGIDAIKRYNRASRQNCHYNRAKRLRCFIRFTVSLVIVFFTFASISLSSAIQKQRIANSLDPVKQFYAIESSNCIIVEVVHIVNRRQKRRRKDSRGCITSYTNIGCEDVYIYHLSLPQQHIEGTGILLELGIESEIHVYQSIEHAIERGVRSCKDSDGPVDPYFHVSKETQCWRPRPPPKSESESESESGSSTLTSKSKYSTQSKVPDAYNCGNDSCLKVFDPQNDADVV